MRFSIFVLAFVCVPFLSVVRGKTFAAAALFINKLMETQGKQSNMHARSLNAIFVVQRE